MRIYQSCLKTFINKISIIILPKRGHMRSILKSKKGAIELSMTTVVIIVLSMTMLVLGLTLIKTLFTGAIYTAQSMNTQIQTKINQAFQETSTTVAIVKESGMVNPELAKDQCVWWAIQADVPGTYSYKATVSAEECATKYGVSQATIESWFTGLTGSMTLSANQIKNNCLLLSLPKTAPSCLFKVSIVANGPAGTVYGSDDTFVRARKPGLFG